MFLQNLELKPLGVFNVAQSFKHVILLSTINSMIGNVKGFKIGSSQHQSFRSNPIFIVTNLTYRQKQYPV